MRSLRPRPSLLLLAGAVLAQLALSAQPAAGVDTLLTVIVKPGEDWCFYEDIKDAPQLSMEFQVSGQRRGGR